jgi:alkylation response protein AidB-like acyl-CoA dehydrogenase
MATMVRTSKCELSESSEKLLQALASNGVDLAQQDRRCEEAGSPLGMITFLRECGALSAPLPVENGGYGWCEEAGDHESLWRALRLVGYASLSLGRIYEAHINAIHLLRRYASKDVFWRAASDVCDGHLLALWVTAERPLQLEKTSVGLRLRGRMEFCTAAGIATRAIIAAQDGDSSSRLVYANVETAIVQAGEGPHMQGMRATATSPAALDLTLAEDCLVGQAGDYLRQPDFSAGAWRTLAVTTGGVEALVDQCTSQLKARRRHTNPHQAARLGRMYIARQSALMWTEHSARLAVMNASDGGSITAFVNLARVAVEDACLSVIADVQKSLGIAGMLRANPAEQLMRDLATYLRQPAGDEGLTEAASWVADHGSVGW